MQIMVKSTHAVAVGEQETYYGIPMTMHAGGWLVSEDLDTEKSGIDALLDAGLVIEFDEKLLKAGAGSARARASASAAASVAQAAARAGGTGESDELVDEPTMGDKPDDEPTSKRSHRQR